MGRRIAALVASWCVCATWLGCNVILGNDSAVFAPETANESGAADGASKGDALEDGASADGDLEGGANPDAGPCVETKTNPNHCGSCFHDCRGGSCIDGLCQPVVLVAEPGRPGPITVDGMHVYWANRANGDISRVPITGGATQVIYDGPADTDPGEEFAVHQGHIYFSQSVVDGGVVRCPVTGCANTGPETILPNLDAPDFVSVDDAGVLVFAEATNAGRVARCVLPCNGAIEELAPSESFPQRVASGPGVVVWTKAIPQSVRVKVGTSAPFSIPALNPYGVALVGNEIVFARLDKGPQVVALDGGATRSLLANQNTQTDYLAVSGGQVFFTDTRANGRVLSCPIGGCDGGIVHATGQSQPRSIAVDGNNVYWTNEGTTLDAIGQVMRVAR